jgi:hypothetical protein
VQFGAIIGSNVWYPLYKGDAALSGTIYPYIDNGGSAGSVNYFSDFQVVTNFRPAETNKILASSAVATLNVVGYHVPNVYAASDGSTWFSWQEATADLDADATIKVQRRDPNGNWSAVVTVAGPGSGNNRYNNGYINEWGGQMRIMFSQTTDGWSANSALKYASLSANASNVITVGSIFAPTLPGSNEILPFAPVFKSGSRLLLPVCSDIQAYTAIVYRSDDNGATWAASNTITGTEPFVTTEPDLRQPGVVYRSTSSDNGATWSASAATSIPCPDETNGGVRTAVHKLPDGNNIVIGCRGNDAGNQRSRITAWIVGNGATILRTIPIADYGEAQAAQGTGVDNYNRSQYPDVAVFGNRLDIVWSQTGGRGPGLIRYFTRPLNELPDVATIKRWEQAADKVRALKPATQAEAEAGVNPSAFMTPLRARQARNVIRVLTAAEQRTSTTTLADSGTLTVPVKAGEIWQFEVNLLVRCASGTPGIKVTMNGPANSWNSYATMAAANVAAPTATYNAFTEVVNIVNQYAIIRMTGAFAPTADGNLRLQWAQQVSSADYTQLEAGSYLIAQRVS